MFTKRFIPAALLVAGLAIPAAAQAPAARVQIPDNRYMLSVQEAARHLVRNLERLQGDILFSVNKPDRERHYNRLVQNIFLEARAFDRLVRTEANLPRIQQAFATLDRNLLPVLQTIQEQLPDHPVVQRAAFWVQQANEDLHNAVFGGDTNVEAAAGLVRRQSVALAREARDLLQAGRYLLGNAARDKGVLDHLSRFAAEAKQFAEQLPQNFDRNRVSTLFEPVNRSWTGVAEALNGLDASEFAYLRLNAQRAERLHAQLADRLGFSSERVRLTHPD
jgi:hypothetical protein